MKISIHQPHFMPYEGLFGKMKASDLTVILTNTQYVKGEYLNRVKVLGSWCTLDVLNNKAPMSEILVSSLSVAKMRTTVLTNLFTRANLIRNPNLFDLKQAFDKLIDVHLYRSNTIQLETLNIQLLQIMLDYLSIKTMIFPINYQPIGHSTTARLMSVIDVIRSDSKEIRYLSGVGGLNYLNPKEVPNNVQVYVQEFKEVPNENSMMQLIALKGKNAINCIVNNQSWKPLRAL